MSQNVWDELKTKKKSEWAVWLKSKVTDSRIWTQENGEAALAIGVLIGVCFVLFFKLFIGLIIVLGLLGLIIWQLAPEDEVTQLKEDSESDKSTTDSESSTPEE
ncbi:MAG: hypothetical protein R3A13_06040 [Bdellovibrionota bacterium]